VDLPAEFPNDLNKPDLENLRKQVDEFARLAEKQLTTLLRERRAMEPTAGPSRTVPRAKKKYIKTRFKGMVVGEERESPTKTARRWST